MFEGFFDYVSDKLDEFDWDVDRWWLLGLSIFVFIAEIVVFIGGEGYAGLSFGGILLVIAVMVLVAYAIAAGLITTWRVLQLWAIICVITGIGGLVISLTLTLGCIVAPIYWIKNR